MSFKTDEHGSIRGIDKDEEYRDDTTHLLSSEENAERLAASIGQLDGSNSDVDYCFSEGDYLVELKSYIDKTYGQHYAQSKIQSTEFIMDAGHGEGFCIGNVIKYAQRYGKKAGKNRADLLKVCHYAIMMLHVHDHFNTEEEN